jgi:FecR protein
MLKIVDICLTRMAAGEPPEKCLADYPQYRHELEALLKTASIIASVPRVSPSADFRRLSQARLVNLLRQETNPKEKPQIRNRHWGSLFDNQLLRPLMPVMLILVVVLAVALSYFTGKETNGEAAEVTLSVLSGRTEIQIHGSPDWQLGSDGLILNAGSHVKTAADSYAMLTFVDGSTIKLEPGTEIGVSTSELKDRVSTKIVLLQTVGKTWSYVQPVGSNSADFSIETPSSIISAHGTSFTTEVDPAGLTRVAAVEGTVDVLAQEKEVSLVSQQTQIEPGAAPQPPEPLTTVENTLVVSTGLSAVSTVCDPSGSSTGYLPNGLAINQITGSKNTLFAGGQEINVAQPAPGEYAIIVRSVNQQAVQVNIQLKGPEQGLFVYNEMLNGSADGVWLIRLDISQGSSTPKVAVEPLGDNKIEHVVETKLALERAVPFTVSSTPTSNASNVPEVSSTTAVPPPYMPVETVSPATTVISTPVISPVTTPPAISTSSQPTAVVTSGTTTKPAATPNPGITAKPTDTTKPAVAPTAVINTGAVVTPTPTPKPTPAVTSKPGDTTVKTTTTPAITGAVNTGASKSSSASTQE